MIESISGLFLVMIGLAAIALQRLYSSVPVRELKRLAANGDYLAHALYRPVAHGARLRIFLWFIAGLSVASGFMLVAHSLPNVVVLVIFVAVLSAALVWLPSLRLTVRRAGVVSHVSGPISAMVEIFHPLLEFIERHTNRHRGLSSHSELYEKDDLVRLLIAQREQNDNRIAEQALDLAIRALHFNDKQAADIAQPRNKVHRIASTETIGPLLLDKLHKSNQQSFLIYEGSDARIVGSLAMADALQARHGGKVSEYMHKDVLYVQEDDSLLQVLTAFQESGSQIAVVVNNFGECSGVIAFKHIIAELFDGLGDGGTASIADRTATANDRSDEGEEQQPLQASPEATEVVE